MVNAVRRLLARRPLAAWLCAVTLVVKLLVPTGYMIDSDRGLFTVIICSGTTPRTMTIEMLGMQGDMPDHGKKDHDKAEMPCAFSGLSAALGAVDPVQLAALIAFIMAIGLVGILPPPPSIPAHLRPHLRGPPAYP